MAKQALGGSDGTVEAAQEGLAAGLGLDGEKQIILFAKRLAANDKAARDQALKRLQAWLAKHKGLSEVDLLKVWKGLFYCMWMSDKAPVQHQLAGNISRIVHCLGDDLPRVKLFITTFYRTIRREWAGLDQHRLDKFYSFMRLMLRECLKFAKERRWSDDSLASAVFPLDTEILLQAPSSMPNGPRLHLCDLILPELAQVAGADITTDDFLKVLHPFLHTMSKGGDKLLATRARERVLLDFVSERSKRAAASDDGEGLDEPYFPHVAVEEVQTIVFDLASSPDIREGLRADMYAAHQRFQRLTGKKMAGSKRRADDLLGDVGGGGSQGQEAKAREGHRPRKQVKLGKQEKQTASVLEKAAQEAMLQVSGEHPKKEKTSQTEEGKGSGKGQKRKLSGGQTKGGHDFSKEETLVNDAVKVQEGKVKEATGDMSKRENKKQKPKGQANRDEQSPAQGPNAVEQGGAPSDAVMDARVKKKKRKAKAQALEVGTDAPDTSGGGEGAAAAVTVGDKPVKSKTDKKTSGVKAAESATNGKAPAAAQQQLAAKAAAAGEADVKRAKGRGGGGEHNTGGIKPVEAASDANAASSDAKKPPPFIPSSKFVGAKPLYAFKKGSKGVGYYLDAVQMGKGPALQKKVRFGKVHVRVFRTGEGQKKKKNKGKRRDPPGTVSFMGKQGGKGMRPKASAYF